MFGMSWAEIIIIVTVGMFVLGPERIPVAVKWLVRRSRLSGPWPQALKNSCRASSGPSWKN